MYTLSIVQVRVDINKSPIFPHELSLLLYSSIVTECEKLCWYFSTYNEQFYTVLSLYWLQHVHVLEHTQTKILYHENNHLQISITNQTPKEGDIIIILKVDSYYKVC